MTEVVAWLGTPSGIPPLATTNRIDVLEWERMGWKVTPLCAAREPVGEELRQRASASGDPGIC